MKTILVNILAILVIVGLALPMVGGTMASWSDSETSYGNFIETGSLDLLVAKCDADWQNCGLFNDDLPWGIGLDPCFDIPELKLDKTYACYLLLWNAGCVDGVAYLHIKDVADNSLSTKTIMHIWYDDDGDPATLVLVESGTIGDLDCDEIELGLLPGEAERQLKLEIESSSASAGDSLSFDIVFQLIQLELLERGCGWADTEQSPNYVSVPAGEGCTPGFWQGGDGEKLWNVNNDPHWTAAGGDGTNPFIHTTLFNDFFTSHDDLAGLTMFQLVKTGGGSNWARKTARDVVAAYLNASFGMDYPLEADEISDAWKEAVDTDTDAAFTALHLELDEYNNYGCDLCD